jgi:hypothetical protein
MLTLLGSDKGLGKQPNRREILRAGGLGLMGISLPNLLQAEALLAASGTPSFAKCKSVIFLFLFGGPSQLETFDMKPDAPEKIRGPYKPISCKTPELLICEHLPKTAAITDKLCVIRTMSHGFNDHSGGAHYLQTGKQWHVPIGGGFSPTPRDWPSMGSIVEYVDQSKQGVHGALPSYMVVPNSLGRLQEQGQYPRPGEHAGWLGQRYNPLTTRIDKKSLTDNPYWRDCSDDELTFRINGMGMQDGLTIDRLNDRRSLLSQLNDEIKTKDLILNGKGLDDFRQRAYELVTSEKAKLALDIRQEPAEIRDRYGRHLFGQASLMARRLVEAGVRFVTVQYDCVDGYSWDSHRNSDDVGKHLLPTFDQAYSALISDLEQRGLLDDTLVVATGEMGRTPAANAQWGRDHWSTLFSTVLAGAGIPGGQVYGKSDKDAAYAIEKVVSPEDLAATIYHALGIDHEMRVNDFQNRPTPIVDGGKPVLQLWG